ncbi:MAG: hypothetical protein IPG45_06010 [Deltaproteobacteria bacterium]|nr:hypothetical protein [Deltaproteobacteria bacterium]
MSDPIFTNPPPAGGETATGEKVCAFPKCGVPIRGATGPGRPQKWCESHANQRHRNRKLRALASDGDPEAVQLLSLAGQDALGDATQLSKTQRLAVALSATPIVDDAAEMVGLDLEPSELRDLEQRARADHPDLVEGRVAGLASLSSQAIALLMIRVRDTALHLPPGQAAGALKQAADVAERLLGGVAPSFSQVTVELNLGPKPAPVPPAPSPSKP